MHSQFPHIFQPFQLKNLTIRNRIMVSGHFAGWWVDNGLPSDSFVDYVEERAKGGVGLFVIGATSPEPGSGWMENLSDAIIPRYRKLADAGHRHGTAIIAQLCHPGYGPLPGVPVYAPAMTSPLVVPPKPPVRYIPTRGDLHRLIANFGAAAGRASMGGVDGVELHSHESFLHAQMLNPLWNTREDEYGGSLENRMRFLIETLQAMRAAMGNELPLGVRLKMDDMAQRGMTQDEYIAVAKHLEAANLVDYILFTGGDGRFHHGPMPRPEGEWIPLVKQMRQALTLPLMHAGRITTPEMAEQMLAEGDVDMVCMTKTHICDPHFTRKVWENRLDDIRYCTRCLQSCHGNGAGMTCVYNPVTKRETQWAELLPAEQPKRVVIVGAGPAGMQCAMDAAERGHEVIVLEKGGRVGGQVWYGAASPLRKSWARIAEFYTRQCRKGTFRVELNTVADADGILDLKPDVVVIACGSSPKRLTIAGEGGNQSFTVHEALNGKADAAQTVVIYDAEGFNRPGVVADYFSAQGKTVHYLSPQDRLRIAGDLLMLEEMTTRLLERGVQFGLAEEIVGWDTPGVLRLRNTIDGTERLLMNVDAVVAAVGSQSNNGLFAELTGRVPELHLIGDAKLPATVEQATVDGGQIARML
jgi:2,4-dienoyl-CoA reductase-like NADH-dependent reductase (Old Yellow Enzyme family)/thioredoxin reductase